jgi:hypothetical protein
MWFMPLDLSETETAAVIQLLKHAIAYDLYPLSERVQTWQGILDKLEPRPVRTPATPTTKVYAPPTKGRWRPAADETLSRPANDVGQCRRSPRPTHGLVQSLWLPKRTRSGRSGTLVRARDASARMAQEARLLTMRQPQCRHGGDRDETVKEVQAYCTLGPIK